MLDAVKASLKRLQLDHIDLYQIHGIDPVTPVEETIEALDQLVRQGLVRYVGRLELGGMAGGQGARASPSGAASTRIASLAGLLHRGRPRPRARDRADARLRRRRADGLEPAGRRAALGQVRRRRARAPDGRRASFDFPPVDTRPAARRARRAAASRRGDGRHGGAGGAGLAAAPAGGDQRHRSAPTGPSSSPTISPPPRSGSPPTISRRSTRRARCPGISRLDARAAGGQPLEHFRINPARSPSL